MSINLLCCMFMTACTIACACSKLDNANTAPLGIQQRWYEGDPLGSPAKNNDSDQ